MMLKINTDSKKEIINSLEEIALDIITNRKIVINESKYSFIDIEFYFWHSNHQDEYTLDHNRRPKGEFEIHRFGVDISLGDSKSEYGGILIRGLYDENNKKVIPKSHIVKELYNQFVIGKNNRFDLIKEKSQWNDIFSTKRLNLGKADTKKEKFVDKDYRFLANDMMIFKKYPNKEAIFKNSNLNDQDIEELLGYKIKR